MSQENPLVLLLVGCSRHSRLDHSVQVADLARSWICGECRKCRKTPGEERRSVFLNQGQCGSFYSWSRQIIGHSAEIVVCLERLLTVAGGHLVSYIFTGPVFSLMHLSLCFPPSGDRSPPNQRVLSCHRLPVLRPEAWSCGARHEGISTFHTELHLNWI